MPPQLALAADGEQMPALVAGRLLVVAEVEEARMVEDLHRVLDQVLAHLVVLFRRDHPVVVLEPGVVARREVHLRDHLEPHAAQAGQLGAQTLHAPAALHRQLGMARIDDDLREVDHDLVAAGRGERVGKAPPRLLVEPHVIRAAARQPLLAQRGVLPLERHVLPRVDAEVRQVRPGEFRGRRLRGRRAADSARQSAERRRHEIASCECHVISFVVVVGHQAIVQGSIIA